MPIYYFTLLSIFSAALLLVIAWWAWRLQGSRGSKPFALLALSCAVYALSYAFQISSPDLERILFWMKVEYLAIPLVPAFLVLFALAYTGRLSRPSLPVLAAIFLIPAATILLFHTNEYHHLYYRAISLSAEGPFQLLSVQHGPWYWLHMAYSCSAGIFSIALLLFMWLNAAAVYRKQISIILAGCILPGIISLLYMLDIISWNIDLNPIALSLSALIIAWGFLRYSLMESDPVARNVLFQILPEGVLVLDSQLRLLDLNATAEHYLGIDSKSIGQSAGELFKNWPEFASLITGTAAHLRQNIRLGERWFMVGMAPLSYGRMIMMRDITELKQVEEALHLLATTDELTGLWNRRHFIESLKQEIERARRYNHQFSFILLDIDNFKGINDSLGHAAGDAALQHLATVIKKVLRRVDIVGRLGGEEFGILLPVTDLNEAVIFSERIRKSVEAAPAQYNHREISITVSMGVTSYRPGACVDEIINTADEALYEAKARGKNCIVKKEIKIAENSL
ncbi:MAG: histidine kinase N-terminal 7TM domain-containing protein [Dethiobacteria bacterium]|jgi:diguanylate cyclase (GGDEF)-like protein|nr:diguanylate cyclase [Bacillota bacterium]HOP68809.1 histidine kinase N-terminal 7TM domain-containing protein [Bacillota bacterium]HPT34127.1 histidine kinase N-terminal 7TM domain-containing protein [Bacillota bacterium]HPZ64095.1 histidine kinase N-terminal 7TM domain-containing protein [Bacillota bacterium]HQD06100.1 histidine kinase N-terminal 7TM domain-containing protein [Bacillota bacterium]